LRKQTASDRFGFVDTQQWLGKALHYFDVIIIFLEK
jgi:hypothetical protein